MVKTRRGYAAASAQESLSGRKRNYDSIRSEAEGSRTATRRKTSGQMAVGVEASYTSPVHKVDRPEHISGHAEAIESKLGQNESDKKSRPSTSVKTLKPANTGQKSKNQTEGYATKLKRLFEDYDRDCWEKSRSIPGQIDGASHGQYPTSIYYPSLTVSANNLPSTPCPSPSRLSMDDQASVYYPMAHGLPRRIAYTQEYVGSDLHTAGVSLAPTDGLLPPQMGNNSEVVQPGANPDNSSRVSYQPFGQLVPPRKQQHMSAPHILPNNGVHYDLMCLQPEPGTKASSRRYSLRQLATRSYPISTSWSLPSPPPSAFAKSSSLPHDGIGPCNCIAQSSNTGPPARGSRQMPRLQDLLSPAPTSTSDSEVLLPANGGTAQQGSAQPTLDSQPMPKDSAPQLRYSIRAHRNQSDKAYEPRERQQPPNGMSILGLACEMRNSAVDQYPTHEPQYGPQHRRIEQLRCSEAEYGVRHRYFERLKLPPPQPGVSGRRIEQYKLSGPQSKDEHKSGPSRTDEYFVSNTPSRKLPEVNWRKIQPSPLLNESVWDTPGPSTADIATTHPAGMSAKRAGKLPVVHCRGASTRLDWIGSNAPRPWEAVTGISHGATIIGESAGGVPTVHLRGGSCSAWSNEVMRDASGPPGTTTAPWHGDMLSDECTGELRKRDWLDALPPSLREEVRRTAVMSGSIASRRERLFVEA